MSNLTILKNSIRTLDNLYSLNDLHLASGNDPKHRPNQFIRLDTTQELIKEINQISDLQICRSVKSLHTDINKNCDAQICASVKSLRTGINKGTWACEELALAYATWISPKFHLVVLRAFIAMHRGEQPKQLTLPNPERKFPFELSEYELQCMAWDWFALFKCVEFTSYILPALESIQSKFAAQASSIVSEYGSMLRRHQPIIQKLTAEFKTGMWENENWNRVLPTIRDNDLLRPKRQLGKF